MQSTQNKKTLSLGLSKSSKMLILFLSLIWSTANANEIIIKKNVKAPFDGVLLPEKEYRFYVAKEFEVKDLKEGNILLNRKLQEMSINNDELQSRESHSVNWFFGGVILGLVGCLLSN